MFSFVLLNNFIPRHYIGFRHFSFRIHPQHSKHTLFAPTDTSSLSGRDPWTGLPLPSSPCPAQPLSPAKGLIGFAALSDVPQADPRSDWREGCQAAGCTSAGRGGPPQQLLPRGAHFAAVEVPAMGKGFSMDCEAASTRQNRCPISKSKACISVWKLRT